MLSLLCDSLYVIYLFDSTQCDSIVCYIYIYVLLLDSRVIHSFYFTYSFCFCIFVIMHQLTDFFSFYLKFIQKKKLFLVRWPQPIFWHRSRTLFVSDISGRKMWEVVRDSIQTVTPHVSITRLSTHTHTHTYTHTLSPSLSLFHSHSLSLTRTRTHTHKYTQTHPFGAAAKPLSCKYPNLI